MPRGQQDWQGFLEHCDKQPFMPTQEIELAFFHCVNQEMDTGFILSHFSLISLMLEAYSDRPDIAPCSLTASNTGMSLWGKFWLLERIEIDVKRLKQKKVCCLADSLLPLFWNLDMFCMFCKGSLRL